LPKEIHDKNAIRHIQNCLSGDIDAHLSAVYTLFYDLAQDDEMKAGELFTFMQKR